MSGDKIQQLACTIDATGKPIGVMGLDGLEYAFPYLTQTEAAFTDASGTPGAAIINAERGRVAIAAGASSVVVTNSKVKTTSVVFAVIDQAAADGTLLHVERVAPANGSFTIYGNANATGNVTVRFVVFN